MVSNIVDRHASLTGWTPSLPVPIEDILESVYDLRILWTEIEEGPGEQILGALVPSTRTVKMNERHLDGRLARMGPTNFTFAHELGHWLFDAGDPNQGALFTDDTPVFCRGADDRHRDAVVRERNCDRFAARMLLPARFLDVEELARLRDDQLRDAARAWGVSATTLTIRIEELVGPPTGPRSSRLL
jgi:hypothetical protein